MLAGHGVDALHGRHDAQLLAAGADLQVLLLHVAFGMQDEAGNLEVREAQTLGLAQHVGGDVFNPVVLRKNALVVHDVLQAGDEPGVYLGEFHDALDAVALFQRLGDGEDAQVGGMGQLVVEVVEGQALVAHEAVHALAYHAQALLDDFLEGAADGHDFAHGLHGGTDFAADAHELRQVPARYLADEVVQRGSHIGGIGRAHLANLVEGVTQGNLGGHEGQGIARGLAGQCGRTAEAGVDLDDAVVIGLGVEGVLDVALAHDAQVADTPAAEGLQLLHLLLRQRTGGSHHDALAGVYAQRVEVLHRSHGETMVVGVADNLELNFLPALQALLHQDLLGEGEGALGQFQEGLLVGTDAAALSAQCVGAAHHDGIANLLRGLQRVAHRLHGVALGRLHGDFVQLLDEEVTVFGVHDSLHGGAQHTHAVLLQDALLIQLRAAVQGRLSAEGQQDAVGTLLLDDALHEVRGDGEEIHLVGNAFRGLDGGDVGIDQHRRNAFFAQSLQRLRAGVVELACLSDFQRARPEDEHFPEFCFHNSLYLVVYCWSASCIRP